jgi:Domain of unknown function (DUF4129)
MLASQVPASGPLIVWPRGAIHDTVAAIVRQAPYRRDLTTTLLDRILRSIAELLDRLGQALGGLPHSRLIASVATAIVVILVAARVLYAARLRTAEIEEWQAPDGRSVVSDDPWRVAERLANEGRFTDAAHALYRAAVAMLAARGLVRWHDSKTSGDYARELRRRGAAAYAPFRRFGSRYDRIIYGTGTCDATEYALLFDDARALAAVRGAERAA